MGRQKDGWAMKQGGVLGRANVKTSMPSTRWARRKTSEKVTERSGLTDRPQRREGEDGQWAVGAAALLHTPQPTATNDTFRRFTISLARSLSVRVSGGGALSSFGGRESEIRQDRRKLRRRMSMMGHTQKGRGTPWLRG